MVDVTTLEAIALRLPANDTVRDTVSEPRNEAPWNKDQRNEVHRSERILALREAIERSEYSVSASQLADAIQRTVRRAN